MRPDVLVIGGGVIGCAAAESLGRSGARVAVVAPHGVGVGATQASAGMLVPFSEGRDDPLMASLGVRSLAMYDALIERLQDHADPRLPLLVRTGSLEVAFGEEEAAGLRAHAQALAADGIPSAFLSAAEARALEPRLAPDCAGALHVAAHGYTRAAGLTAALWMACARRGAELIDGAVQRIESAGPHEVQVRLRDGRALAAPAVVLAAGSWAGQIDIAGGPALPVRPIRGQILQLAWEDEPLTCILWSSQCYTLTWRDGTMLAGATVEDVGYDERATVAGVRDLLDGLCDLVPGAWQARFTGVRVGLRPQTPDGLPIVGRSHRIPGLVYAAGHYRNGILLAPLTGALVAAAVSGADDEAFAVTDPQRFGEY